MATQETTVIQRVAEALAAAAASRGLGLEDFLRDLGGFPAAGPVPQQVASPGEFDGWLDELAAGPDSGASLPADFSRADVYHDRD